MLLNDTLGDITATTTTNTITNTTDNNNIANISNCTNENESFNIYREYLTAGLDFNTFNPTDVENSIIIPFTSQIDEWSSTEEINKQKAIIHSKIVLHSFI